MCWLLYGGTWRATFQLMSTRLLVSHRSSVEVSARPIRREYINCNQTRPPSHPTHTLNEINIRNEQCAVAPKRERGWLFIRHHDHRIVPDNPPQTDMRRVGRLYCQCLRTHTNTHKHTRMYVHAHVILQSRLQTKKSARSMVGAFFGQANMRCVYVWLIIK